ncbi:hypothetical protein COE30_12845 [Bacillus cereus]|nr:hypothetical protein COE30_12845 [Bacillus cereus]
MTKYVFIFGIQTKSLFDIKSKEQLAKAICPVLEEKSIVTDWRIQSMYRISGFIQKKLKRAPSSRALSKLGPQRVVWHTR